MFGREFWEGLNTSPASNEEKSDLIVSMSQSICANRAHGSSSREDILRSFEDRLLSKEALMRSFKNGEERYVTDATFRVCIDSLLMGASPFEILDQVLMTNAALAAQNEQLILKFPIVLEKIEDITLRYRR